MSTFIPQGMGWHPDLPDARDYTDRHDAVLPLLRRLKRSRRKTLPSEVDLRCEDEAEYLTPPEDQGPLNCSSICAVLSLVEYFERRVRGRTFEGSKLFLYKATRNRLQKRLRVMGDTGADLRTTLKVLVQRSEQDPKRRLSDTTKCLNRKQTNELIRFRGDGTGEGVTWELVGQDGSDDGPSD